MRVLITLSLLQTFGIVLLVVHAFGDPGQLGPEQRLGNSASPAISEPDTPGRAQGSAPLGDEEHLRNIIREELAQLRVRPTQATNGSAKLSARSHDDPAAHSQQELIAQQIETYKAVASITDEQMQELQTGIAQLDAAGRRQMMGKLVQALNSGELKGRL